MCVHNDNDMQPRVRVIVKLNINPSARNLSLLILSTRIRCNQNISPLRLFYTQDCPFHLKRWEESWRFLLNLIYFLGIHSRMTLFLMKLFSAKMVVTYQFFWKASQSQISFCVVVDLAYLKNHEAFGIAIGTMAETPLVGFPEESTLFATFHSVMFPN